MLHSLSNEFFFQLRSWFKFQRPHYREVGEPLELSPVEKELVEIYQFSGFATHLNALQWRRNLVTLWILHQFASWTEIQCGDSQTFFEVGCQDFSRLPALSSFLKTWQLSGTLTGVEVDPFPILSDWHSRWDRAQYYLSLVPHSVYEVGDFFKYQKKADGIFCFFPFVSPRPALKWGLPARFADPDQWVQSFLRNTHQASFIFVAHQGEHEQIVFDRARQRWSSDLVLQERHVLNCPFWPPKIPTWVSLYRRMEIASAKSECYQ